MGDTCDVMSLEIFPAEHHLIEANAHAHARHRRNKAIQEVGCLVKSPPVTLFAILKGVFSEKPRLLAIP